MAHFHIPGGALIPQEWETYTEIEHDRWRRLYNRQMGILAERACPEFLDGLKELDMSAGIPDFRKVNEILSKKTGWTVVCVAGLVSDADFFTYLSKRQFPSTRFIREEHELDYLQEPDIFHDGFGHLPLFTNSIYADYLQDYGKGGLRALELDGDDPDQFHLKRIARLYWYTVEFGLVQTAGGLRIYGSGIVSSSKESVYSVESTVPKRVMFDLLRVMRTTYQISNLQEVYFVIPSIKRLMDVTRKDFASVYRELAFFKEKDIEPKLILPRDITVGANASWVKW